MKVKVTRAHIKSGCKNDYGACPIALSLMDMGMTEVAVADGGEDEIEFYDQSGKRVVWALTEKVRAFIDNFDNGEKVKPFTFTLTK